jgi:hypothetical protein
LSSAGAVPSRLQSWPCPRTAVLCRDWYPAGV